MAGSGPQIDQAHFESLQLEVEALRHRILELEEENAALAQKVALLESPVCLRPTQAPLTDEKTLSGVKFEVNGDAEDPKPAAAPEAKPKKETSATSICVISTPEDLKAVDIKDTSILPSEQVDLLQEDAESKQCADNLKAGIIKLETLDTQSPLAAQSNSTKLSSSPPSPLQFNKCLDVKPKQQPEVLLPPVPKVSRQPRQRKSRHDKLSKPPGTLNILDQLWDDLRHPSIIAQDASMADLTEENAGDAVDRKKVMESYENPEAKVTVKKEAISLSADSVYDRIEKVGHGVFDIKAPDDLKSKSITRRFLSAVYGGNMQATFARPSRSFVEQHGIEQFMCLIKEFNPHAPTLPGAPGLFFGDGEYLEWPQDSERVFTRTGPAEWLYQGDYELVRCDSLTPGEYCSLDKTARDTWSKGAISSASWGMATRARIMLRKELKRKPKTGEVKAKIAFLKANEHLDTITAEEVDAAYSSGKEDIAIWAMKCVGYDVEFQRTLIERFDTWVQLEPKEKKKGKGAESSRGRGKASTKSPSKRRRPRSRSIVSSDSDGSDDNIQTLGTKSRPAKRIRLGSEVF
ncbi:hypothetical protein BD410DRAFT_753288 [Rickenella mellea]|uniref:DUF6697 domain-containing protein n=1 Tax=Rickenella mellea TaxID=50990 RepID=A0A4Y7PU56_9AGAM|nr:hypothetical protein BD410DRAFT_753288 [Rickenella mellea]